MSLNAEQLAGVLYHHLSKLRLCSAHSQQLAGNVSHCIVGIRSVLLPGIAAYDDVIGADLPDGIEILWRAELCSRSDDKCAYELQVGTRLAASFICGTVMSIGCPIAWVTMMRSIPCFFASLITSSASAADR